MSYRFVRVRPSNTGFDIRVNFWEDNQQVRYIQPFKQLYDQDTSKDKVQSSNFMWCIWLYQDPNYDNKIYRLSEQDKRSAIKSYCPEFDFEDDLINECLLAYPEHCLSPAAKAFKVEEESLVKRAKFIDEAEYTFPSLAKNAKGEIIYVSGKPMQIPGTAKDIDYMRKMSLDIYKKYDGIRRVFEEEQNEIRLYGGGKETIMERGGMVLIPDEEE